MKLDLQLLLILLLAPFCMLTAQNETSTLEGIILSESGELLEDASILVREIGSMTKPDKTGYYSMDLPYGQYTVKFMAPGQKSQTFKVDLTKNARKDVIMEPKPEKYKASSLLNPIYGSITNPIMKGVLANRPSAAEPAQNPKGVWHYICTAGCEGGAGKAQPCKTCGNALQHNQAYHEK